MATLKGSITTLNGIKEISGTRDTRAIALFGPSCPVHTMAATRPKLGIPVSKPCLEPTDDCDISHSYRQAREDPTEDEPANDEPTDDEPTQDEPTEEPNEDETEQELEAKAPYLDTTTDTTAATTAAKPTRKGRLASATFERCSYKWVPYDKGVWQPKAQASGQASSSSDQGITPARQRPTILAYRTQRSTDDLEALVKQDELDISSTARPTKKRRQN